MFEKLFEKEKEDFCGVCLLPLIAVAGIGAGTAANKFEEEKRRKTMIILIIVSIVLTIVFILWWFKDCEECKIK
jgi:flagellar basal body-associated protein FliL